MIYPEFIRQGQTIGICAPSQGVGHKLEDFDKSLATLHSLGYKTKETASVRLHDSRGGDAKTRGEELNSLFRDPEVQMIMCAAGGDFLFEMIPYADFALIQKNPKWLMGASDPTGLLFPLTSKYDVATLYGANAGSYDIEPLPQYLKNNLELIKGSLIVQNSFEKYMKLPTFMAEKIEFDTPVRWEAAVDHLDVSGRCIGGCIDVLKDVIGTRFDGGADFAQRYADDGIIWYFDDFSLGAEIFYRTLLQMRYAGWFENTKAVIVGRVLFESSDTGMTYAEAIDRAFDDIPVLYNADIGHTVPSMTMINGALLHLQYADHKAALQFELK